MSNPPPVSVRDATIAGLSGYLIWGVSPLFFRLLDFASALEIVLHRVVWAVPLLFGLLWLTGSLKLTFQSITNKRVLLTLIGTAFLISVNWWTFVYAVNSGALLQASLGYYINPLMSVAVGVVVLREPLGRWRIAAVTFAALGVINQIVAVGELPWITLLLATSFTAYGYLRKTVPVDGRIGLFWETVFVLPFAIGGLGWLYGQGIVGLPDSATQLGLLAMAGVITVVPLTLYIIGTRGLRLSTMGVLQFIAPSLQFILGVVAGEPFTSAHMVTFALIWTGVGLFTWSQLRREDSAA
jgi:chloramphenicol-sensitive protein RarD